MGLDVTASDGNDEEFSFRAGSYSGYNLWREQLAAIAGYTPQEAWDAKAVGKPFREMVDFSDCEGMLDTDTCAKLSADFAVFQEKADAHSSEYFREIYSKFRTAFEMAAVGGRVVYH